MRSMTYLLKTQQHQGPGPNQGAQLYGVHGKGEARVVHHVYKAKAFHLGRQVEGGQPVSYTHLTLPTTRSV